MGVRNRYKRDARIKVLGRVTRNVPDKEREGGGGGGVKMRTE